MTVHGADPPPAPGNPVLAAPRSRSETVPCRAAVLLPGTLLRVGVLLMLNSVHSRSHRQGDPKSEVTRGWSGGAGDPSPLCTHRSEAPPSARRQTPGAVCTQAPPPPPPPGDPGRVHPPRPPSPRPVSKTKTASGPESWTTFWDAPWAQKEGVEPRRALQPPGEAGLERWSRKMELVLNYDPQFTSHFSEE